MVMIPARYASRVVSDEHDDNPVAGSAGSDDLGFPVAGEDPAAADREESGDEAPAQERELTAMEMMGAPNRPSDQARKTVLWMSLAFASVLFAMTIAVITLYGLDILTLFTAVILGFVLAAMIGALRYKGEDPMAQFDPPPRPKRRFGRRKK
jgi:hypothetical protein